VKIDQSTFEQTAKVVHIINPTMAEQYDTWQDLESYMTHLAYSMKEGCTFMGTGGFYLTQFSTSEGRTITATVMPYTALKYIERLQALAGI
jgi:hypothetical protein